ncbi:MAG: biotin/lipoyl-binding carrier protein, partial [Lachnospiraceae bacterium]|nr:biotin/lipoyl-binding carrier protein [Lachnospiraceae bacterium]
APAPAPAPAASGSAGSVEIAASVPGKVFNIPAKVGDSVSAGDTVIVLESMKMEIPVVAPQDGTIASIDVTAGAQVDTGDLLATMN